MTDRPTTMKPYFVKQWMDDNPNVPGAKEFRENLTKSQGVKAPKAQQEKPAAEKKND